MEKVMKKVNELFGTLQAGVAENAAKAAELDKALAEVKAEQLKVSEADAEIKRRERAVKKITDILAEQEKAAALKKEAEAQLIEVDKAKADLDILREQAEDKLSNAEQTEAESLAERQRIRVEVKRLDELKANYKEEVLAELRGN